MGSQTQKIRDVNTKESVHSITKLRCIYTNIDSITNKIDELEHVIGIHKAHVVLVNEVKPKNSRYIMSKEELTIEGFTAYGRNLDNKVGRGIIIYVKDSISSHVKEVDDMHSCNQEDFVESLWLELAMAHTTCKIGCVYRSPNSSTENNKNMLVTMENIVKPNCPTIIAGDFNYRGIDWDTWTVTGNDSDEGKLNFLNCMREHCDEQYVKTPTRCRGADTPSLLDLVFSNTPELVEDLQLQGPIGNSDHAVVTFNLVLNLENNTEIKYRKDYKKGNFTGLKAELNNINWDQMLKGDINQKWVIFKQTVLKLEDKYIPTKKITYNHKHKLNLSLDVRKSVKKKHGLWKKYMNTRDGSDYREYCKSRNKVKNLIKKIRKEKERDIANSIKTNPKTFWQYIKSKKTVKEGVAPLITDPTNPNSKIAESDGDKAEVLATFFSSVFTQEPTDEIPTLPNIELGNIMTELDITEEMVLKVLLKINPSKSGGPDGLQSRLLSEIAVDIVVPITQIFKDSLASMKLPEDWKHARVSALFKKGKKNLANNYRPVSLTSILCKCMEHIIRNHIYNYMKTCRLFSKNQFGFLNGRSTSLQLLKVMNDWTLSLENGHMVHCAYMDFMKAFDTVPHRRLLYKMNHYGIANPITGWVQDFLTDRKQYVQIKDSRSIWHTVTSGIPQGSVLGP